VKQPRLDALIGCLALVGALVLLLAGCSGEPPAQKRMQTVKLLPDTPPPPPPPPKPEDRPPPKPEKQEQAPQPKPDAPAPQQALREEGPTGTGPGSGLQAGTVTQDYTDQKPSTTVGGGSTDNGAQRLAQAAFANATTRSLNAFLANERSLKRLDYQVRVDVWFNRTGTLERAELVGSTGDAGTDRALREALQRFPGAQASLPDSMPQPMRVLVTNRLMG